jgi:predicted metalloprotease
VKRTAGKRLASLLAGTALLTTIGVLLASPASAFPVDTEQEVSDELVYTVHDVSDYWASQVDGWQPVEYNVFSGSQELQSACGTVSSDPDVGSPASYCTGDTTIYLSAQWIYENIAQPYTDDDGTEHDGGDFGPAVVVAHEMGHALQQELGIENIPGFGSVQPLELQADCFAGLWANAKDANSQLEEGDLEEAVAALGHAGDYDFHSESHHGTPAERQRAFLAGYRGTGISDCPLNVGA